jgi:cytochrome P450
MDFTGRAILISYIRILDTRFSEIICSRMAKSAENHTPASRSILSLALETDNAPLTPKTLQRTVSQMKTFLFAGEDTTATTAQWVIYNISRHPHVLAKLRAEHEAIFGGRPVEEVIGERPKEVLNGMVYTTAVIKETLRLNPPAATARASPEGSGFEVVVDGARMRLDGALLLINHHIIHRNEKAS